MCRILHGEGNGTPLQYSCLENPMDGGAWWAAVHGVARVRHDWAISLSLFTFMHWRRKWQHTPVFLPGESQGRGSLVGCCESDTTEATYSSSSSRILQVFIQSSNKWDSHLWLQFLSSHLAFHLSPYHSLFSSRSLANGGTCRPKWHLLWSRTMPSRKQRSSSPWQGDFNPPGKSGPLGCVTVNSTIVRVSSQGHGCPASKPISKTILRKFQNETDSASIGVGDLGLWVTFSSLHSQTLI